MKTIDRLFSALKAEHGLVAEQRVVAARLVGARKAIKLGIAQLAAETSEPRPPSDDYRCGCLVIDGVLWRDCKTPIVATGTPRPLYQYEEDELRRTAEAKAARDRATGADKEPCDRLRVAGAS